MIYIYIYNIHIYIYTYIYIAAREKQNHAHSVVRRPLVTDFVSRLRREDKPSVAVAISPVHCRFVASFIIAMRCGAKLNARRLWRRWLAGGGVAVVVLVLGGVALAALVFDLQLEILRSHFLRLRRLVVPKPQSAVVPKPGPVGPARPPVEQPPAHLTRQHA